MSFHFTAHADARIDSHVRADLDLVRKVVTSSYPQVLAVLLVGGFGRGEGSVLVSPNGHIQVINDYDVVVVFDGPNLVGLKQISERLANQLGIRFVDLIPIRRNRLPRLAYTMFNFDMKHGSHVFHGPEDIVSVLPDWDPTLMPISEAWVLFFNRLLCLLEAHPEDLGQGASAFVYTQVTKAILGCADTALVLNNRYVTRYAAKQVAFERLSTLQQYRDIVRQATASKLDPQVLPQVTPLEYWVEAMRMYQQTYAQLCDHVDHPQTGHVEIMKDVIRTLLRRPTRRQIRMLEDLQIEVLRCYGAENRHVSSDTLQKAHRLGFDRTSEGGDLLAQLRRFSVRRWYEIKH